MNEKVLILLDSDVIIHLFKADRISILNELFPKRLRMLDIVANELLHNRTMNKTVQNLFTFKQVEEIAFPTIALLQEYLSLKKKINGAGESACLVYCKHHNHIIASSNTSDIKPYCEEHSIEYLTTLDIFAIAINKGKMTSVEANEFIKKINVGSYLCCQTIENHLKLHFDTKKLLF